MSPPQLRLEEIATKKLMSPQPDKVAVVDVPEPAIGPDDVLVRSVRSLISAGSELKRITRVPGQTDQTWPSHDLGYAICGEVIQCGENVERFRVGDRVATMQHHQEIVASPTGPDVLKATIPIPAGISWDDAPFIIWGRSCWNWTMKADIAIGEAVAVMGLGLVGLLMVMWSRLRGPGRVIGIDLHDSRLELAAKAGADELINASEVNVAEAVADLTGGRGAAVTFHCVAGGAVKSFEDTQRITASGGRVVNIGHHSLPLTILFREFLSKDLLGAGTDYDYDHRLFEVGARLIERGALPVSSVVTHRAHYSEAPAIYEMLRCTPEQAGAVLLCWD